MVVCRAPGGEFYVEGETWNLDECTRCTCRKGRVLCDTEVCPPALCQAPVRNKDTCCHVCPGNRWGTRTEDATRRGCKFCFQLDRRKRFFEVRCFRYQRLGGRLSLCQARRLVKKPAEAGRGLILGLSRLLALDGFS